MTMDTFTASLSAILNCTGGRSIGIDNPSDQLTHTQSDSLTVGTSADNANELYHATRTFSGANDDIDLAGGLTDALGQTITLAEVVFFFLYNKSTSNTITIGAAGANDFVGWFGGATHTESVGAGGWVFRHSPGDGVWSVTAGTGDILRISGTDTETYDLIIGGRNA